MKKVSGCIDVRALGRFDFTFFVEDNATEEEIKTKVEDVCDYYIDYKVESGYKKELKEVYSKI